MWIKKQTWNDSWMYFKVHEPMSLSLCMLMCHLNRKAHKAWKSCFWCKRATDCMLKHLMAGNGQDTTKLLSLITTAADNLSIGELLCRCFNCQVLHCSTHTSKVSNMWKRHSSAWQYAHLTAEYHRFPLCSLFTQSRFPCLSTHLIIFTFALGFGYAYSCS